MNENKKKMMFIYYIFIGIIAIASFFFVYIKYTESQKKLRDIMRETRVAVKVIEEYQKETGRYPCPDVDKDGKEDRLQDGCHAYYGNIPMKTIGKADLFQYPEYLKYVVSPDFIHKKACGQSGCIKLFLSSIPYRSRPECKFMEPFVVITYG